MEGAGPLDGLEPGELRAMVMRDLEPGEVVVWWSKPALRAAADGSRVGAFIGVVFAVIGASSLYGAMSILRNGARSRESIAGLTILVTIVAAIGVGLIWGAVHLIRRPKRLSQGARASAYVMTERRLILFDGMSGSGHRIVSVAWNDVVGFTRHEQEDGTGDLIVHARGAGWGGSILNIAHVRDVERMARERLPNRA